MTYIDYLNKFNRWLDSNSISSTAQLLYFKILDVFNMARWPDYIQLDNLRLACLASVSSEKSAIKARKELVDSGWIKFESGSKGKPSKYLLEINTVNIYCKKYSANSTANIYSTNDSESDSKSLIYNNINNKTLEENKNKTKKENTLILSKAVQLFCEKIDPTAPNQTIMDLLGFVRGMDDECCIRAIEMVLNDHAVKKDWWSVRKILNERFLDGVRNIQEWNEYEAKHYGMNGSRQNGQTPQHHPDWFETIWQLYPVKEARKEAAIEWDKIKNLTEELFDTMKQSIEKQMQTKKWKEGIYVPKLSTWLIGERWTDEVRQDPLSEEEAKRRAIRKKKEEMMEENKRNGDDYR